MYQQVCKHCHWSYFGWIDSEKPTKCPSCGNYYENEGRLDMRTSYEVNKELKDVDYKINRLKKIYEDCEKKYIKASLMMQLCQYALEKFEFDIESATASEIENAKDMSTFQDFAIGEYEKANIEKIKYEYAFRDATRDMEPLKQKKVVLQDEWHRAKRQEDPQMAIPMN